LVDAAFVESAINLDLVRAGAGTKQMRRRRLSTIEGAASFWRPRLRLTGFLVTDEKTAFCKAR
jgi:hypothetical protein